MRTRVMARSATKGFTLIELMIVLVVLVVLLVLAVPSFVDTLDRRRAINATQALTGQIQQARSFAITRNRQVSIVIDKTSDTNWCFGLTDKADCDCSETDPTEEEACTVAFPGDPEVLVRADQTSFGGVRLGAPANTSQIITFEPTRGLRIDGGAGPIAAVGGDDFTFESPRGRVRTLVDVNRIGRISTCSPSGARLAGGIGPC